MADRISKAKRNVKYSVIEQVTKSFAAFITRTIFIRTLGQQALGVDSLFTNILSMLSIAELGLSSAIGFSLYKPLANNDYKTASAIMSFFKKAYRVIAVIVLILGLGLMPFLHYIIKDFSEITNIYLIYSLFLANTVISYLISYKEILAIADQKSSIISKVQIFTILIQNAALITILSLTKNYIFYLTLQILCQITTKIIVNRTITKRYTEVNFKTNEKIDNKELLTIKKNVSALFLHKIGDYCVNGTDNIIISSMISIATVGLYANYLTIIAMVTTFTNIIFNSITSTIGNVIVTEKREIQYEIYKKVDFAGYIIYSFCSIMLISLINPFIEIWVGKNYVLDFSIVIALVVNFYLVGMRVISYTFKTSAGLYRIDRFTPIIQSIINLSISIILAMKLGLLGIVLGTIISGITLPSWQRPYIIYKHIFKKPLLDYVKRHVTYAVVTLFTCTTILLVESKIFFNNIYLNFITTAIISVFIYGLVFFITFHKRSEFKEFLNILLRRKK